MLQNCKMSSLKSSVIFFGCLFIFFCGLRVELLSQEEPPASSSKAELSVNQEAKEEAARKDKEMKQIIGFGIDSDLVIAIQTLIREAPRLPEEEDDYIVWIEETSYNDAIYQRIQKGYSSNELQVEAIRFFMQQKWLGAKEYVQTTIERSVGEERLYSNLLLAALAYVRNLKVQSSEEAVLGLLASQNPQIVEQSMITLGKIGSEKSAQEILRLLEIEDSFAEFSDEQEREVLRTAGISAIGDLAYLSAVGYLMEILQDGRKDERKYSDAEWGAAARALGQMEQPEAVSFIIEQFRNGNTQERYQAIVALNTFSPQDDFEDILLQGLQEAYWKTREVAAKTVGEWELQSAIPGLVYKIAKDSVSGVRRASIKALRQMGAAGSSALKELIKDPDVRETPRLDVLSTLVKARDEAAIAAFRQLLEDDENKFQISRTSIFLVASNHPWKALDFVYREMLVYNDRRAQQAALYSIGQGRIRSLQKDVEEFAENTSDSSLRRAAKSALVHLNS